jgi:hypothetical protein
MVVVLRRNNTNGNVFSLGILINMNIHIVFGALVVRPVMTVGRKSWGASGVDGTEAV